MGLELYMSKEQLVTPIMDMVRFGGDCQEAQKLFNEFFASNICIPKGENRHPYADVFHEWAENGGDLTYAVSTCKTRFAIPDDASYFRIKPSEPIYEWQWKYKRPESTSMWDGYTIYATEDEAKVFQQDWMTYEKDEATKRVRG